MTKARVRTQYVLMGLSLLLLLVSLVVLAKVQEVRDNQDEAIVALRAACERTNSVRDATYFLMTERINDAKIVGAEANSPQIRRRFVGQLTRTLSRREAFVSRTGPHAQSEKQWLVDCEAAFPNP